MLPAALAVEGDDGSIAQVVDGAGRVLAASAGLRRDQPLAHFRPGGSASEARTIHDLPFGDGSFRVIALEADTPDWPVTVYVAASLSPVDDAVEFLQGALAAGAPLLLALVAVTTWMVVGRTLRPVDAIRAQDPHAYRDRTALHPHRRHAPAHRDGDRRSPSRALRANNAGRHDRAVVAEPYPVHGLCVLGRGQHMVAGGELSSWLDRR
ncbi:hypothetical protein [Micromonospora sp. NPDC005299]|uniref:hypothetical protein n=1 Tax=Micromonospora sp. NPDC005299 TaxID=3364231 RepID=UPI0036813D2D